jgi:hypothetical protein
MEVTGSEYDAPTTSRRRLILRAQKPSANDLDNVVFAQRNIPAGTRGPVSASVANDYALARLDGVTPDSIEGVEFGTVGGEWFLRRGKQGFLCLAGRYHTPSTTHYGIVRPFRQSAGLDVDITQVGDGYDSAGDYLLYPIYTYWTEIRFAGGWKWTFDLDGICFVHPGDIYIDRSNYSITSSAGFALTPNVGLNARPGKTLSVSIGGNSFSEPMTSNLYPADIAALYDAAGIPRISSGDTVTTDQLLSWGWFYTLSESPLITLVPVGTGHLDLTASPV